MGVIAFTLGVIAGLILNKFLAMSVPRGHDTHNEIFATKEDLRKIQDEIEQIKKYYRDNYDSLSAEEEFYKEHDIE